MENEELMTMEEVTEESEGTETRSGMGTGLAMLIGGGLTLAAIAGGKKLKKVWKNHKVKTELEKVMEEDTDDDFVDKDIESEEEN